MSYDISLLDDAGNVIQLDKPHDLRGGTYAFGGTQEAWLNITYNYALHFRKVLGENGIRTIYGMSAKESIPLLREAAARLSDDTHPNYWEPTEGNAKKALFNLISLAEAAPHGVWHGD